MDKDIVNFVVMIESKNEFGSLQEIELDDFEKENNIMLPKDYRDFLLTCNGGKPHPDKNDNPSTVVTYVLGMHNGDYYASLYKHVDMFKKRLPLSTLPIATDPFGNLFIMSVHPENYGHIFFWDHEGEPDYQDGHYVENCTFVAYSFSEFINNLR
jgi:hypothetical protein